MVAVPASAGWGLTIRITVSAQAFTVKPNFISRVKRWLSAWVSLLRWCSSRQSVINTTPSTSNAPPAYFDFVEVT